MNKAKVKREEKDAKRYNKIIELMNEMNSIDYPPEEERKIASIKFELEVEALRLKEKWGWE